MVGGVTSVGVKALACRVDGVKSWVLKIGRVRVGGWEPLSEDRVCGGVRV